MIKIIKKDIDELIPYENNARINDAAIDVVANSINDFGFKNPCIIDKNNVLIAGHTRVAACKKLGIKEIPCIVADDLSDEQIKAFRIADNSSAQVAEWDMDKLMAELQDIDYDMAKYGLAEQMEQIAEQISNSGEVQEDDFEPELPEEPKARLGDIYQLGEHRLMCGDSTKEEDVAKLMDGAKADMVFTDPPYGYKYESNYQSKFRMLKNDDKILDFIPNVIDSLKDDVAIYSFCGFQTVKDWLNYFDNTPLKLKNIIVWKKNNWSMGDLKGAYAGQYEILLFLHKGRVELKGGRDTDVWEFDREPPKLHPTMKPIELITKALSNSSKKEDVVLDVFGGSGSTLIACEQLNRKCYMMEFDTHYVDVIIKRWEDFTGKKSVKIN
ncbi:MAG: ParB N-terminal domain-containing protein [Clostridia bacterium]|nr:ParB N-terminal domain-containing protein [Clostridia bacterium]